MNTDSTGTSREFEARISAGFPVTLFETTELGSHAIWLLLTMVGARIDPAVSHALNRISTWLRPSPGERWNGDGLLAVRWSDDASSCVIVDRFENGGPWRVEWGVRYGAPSIVVSSAIDGGKQWQALASGEINDGTRQARNASLGVIIPEDPIGSVHGSLTDLDPTPFFDFARKLGVSMGKDFRSITKNTVTFEHAVRLGKMESLLELDGGMGDGETLRYAEMYENLVYSRVANWIGPKVLEMADALAARGAVWGDGSLSYNDSDYRFCSIPLGKDKIGLFHDDVATCAEDRYHIFAFDYRDGSLVGIDVFPVHEDDDPAIMIDAVQRKAAAPAARLSRTAAGNFMKTSITDPNRGRSALNAFVFCVSNDYLTGLKEGKFTASRVASLPSVP